DVDCAGVDRKKSVRRRSDSSDSSDSDSEADSEAESSDKKKSKEKNRKGTKVGSTGSSSEDSSKDEKAKPPMIPPPGDSRKSPGGELSFSGLLNVLDGVASQEGRILIMTTNHKE